MAFTDTKTDDVSVLVAADWNAFVDYAESISGTTWWISGSYANHSGNLDKHYPSSLFRGWLDSVYAPTGVSSDTSGAITLSSGLKADSTSLWHDGPATQAYLYEVPQSALKSGTSYNSAVASAQITYYSEDDLTSLLDDNYAPSTTSHGLYAPSSLTKDRYTEYTNHSSNVTVHYTSGNLKNWIDSLYAPTSNIPQGALKSGSEYWKGYASAQIATYDGDYYPSGKVSSGFATISHMSLIPHGLGSIPTYANVEPSGLSVNFGTSCKLDATNITVYMTAAGSHNVFWTANI